MKKLLPLLLAFTCLFCSCQFAPLTEESSTTTTPEEQTQLNAAPLVSYSSYEDVPRHSTSKFQRAYYGFENETTVLSLGFPREWTIKETDGKRQILRENRPIGELTVGEPADLPQWNVLNTQVNEQALGTVYQHIEKFIPGGINTFRYRYVYAYTVGNTDRVITLTVDCAEVGVQTERKLFSGSSFESQYSHRVFGSLSHLKDAKEILILGNSFIGTSSVGDILHDLFFQNGKPCNVTAISRGNALVPTYAADEALMDTLREGRYDAVFLCGFYGGNETVQAFTKVKNACDASDTALVIFPAHNENDSTIALARDSHPEIPCLNWKAELDLLIEDGVNRLELCYDDSYGHSTTTAGFVGAHMIYRAIHAELPTIYHTIYLPYGGEVTLNKYFTVYNNSQDIQTIRDFDVTILS